MTVKEFTDVTYSAQFNKMLRMAARLSSAILANHDERIEDGEQSGWIYEVRLRDAEKAIARALYDLGDMAGDEYAEYERL